MVCPIALADEADLRRHGPKSVDAQSSFKRETDRGLSKSSVWRRLETKEASLLDGRLHRHVPKSVDVQSFIKRGGPKAVRE